MPWKRSEYPKNWKEIRARIQARAGDKCERCGVKNHTFIFRSVDSSCWFNPTEDTYYSYPDGKRLPDWHEAELRDKGTKIVCTTAHVDPQTKRNKSDCREEALQFLCQACHLAEDLKDHIRNRRKNQMAKKACGTLF